MSLLNQVLQDLDRRAPSGGEHPVRLAEPAAGAPTPVPVTDWLRVVAWSLVGAAAAGTALLIYPADEPVRQARYIVPLPEITVAAAIAAVPPATGGDTVARVGGPESAMQDITASIAPAAPETSPETAVAAARPTPVPPVVEPAPARMDTPPRIALRNTVIPPAVPEVAPRRAAANVPSAITPAKRAVEPLAAIRAAIAAGELSAAETMLRKRLDDVAGDREARELLVGLMLRGERHDEAMGQLGEGLAHHPDHLKFVLIKARLLARNGDAGDALALLHGRPVGGALASETLQMRGALQQRLGQYRQAAESYRELLRLDPAVAAAWAGLAVSLDALGDAQALGAYRKALALGRLPAAADAYARQRVAVLERSDG